MASIEWRSRGGKALNLTESIDAYCERVDSGLLSEPLNLLTNLSFIAAAVFLFRTIATVGTDRVRPGSRLLVSLIFIIGVGSALFHSAATQWARLADVVPIGIFLVTYLFCFLRWEARLSTVGALFGLAVFGLISAAAAALSNPHVSNGSELYFGAWICLFGIGCFLWGRRQSPSRWLALLSSATLALSLLFRTVDMRVCEAWPYGTHFLWHFFNGFTLYLITRAYIAGEDTPKR